MSDRPRITCSCDGASAIAATAGSDVLPLSLSADPIGEDELSWIASAIHFSAAKMKDTFSSECSVRANSSMAPRPASVCMMSFNPLQRETRIALSMRTNSSRSSELEWSASKTCGRARGT